MFFILNFFSYSNDWEFGSRGEHMVPFKNSKMKIKDEKIMMKLEQFFNMIIMKNTHIFKENATNIDYSVPFML